MAEFLGVDIAQHIADIHGPRVKDATLTKFTAGTRTPGELTGGTNPTSTAYPCKGYIASQANRDVSGTLVDNGSVEIRLIANTISAGSVAPALEDQIAIEGTTYVIRVLDRTPSAATYTCTAHPI